MRPNRKVYQATRHPDNRTPNTGRNAEVAEIAERLDFLLLFLGSLRDLCVSNLIH